ncbi:hypothetical protein PUN4_550152 [Paraburkholderia unamae]|nr:hypothetical protein PUN4_550152 [Paraburkholderia unamae]
MASEPVLANWGAFDFRAFFRLGAPKPLKAQPSDPV